MYEITPRPNFGYTVKTSHRIYSLYKILLTVSSAELGPAKSSPSSCEVARFSSRFFGGRNKLFALAKIALLRSFRHIATVKQQWNLYWAVALLLASGMVKIRQFLTPYSQNSPGGSTLKMTCFLAHRPGWTVWRVLLGILGAVVPPSSPCNSDQKMSFFTPVFKRKLVITTNVFECNVMIWYSVNQKPNTQDKEFTICRPTPYLPPQILHLTIVFHFSWVLQLSQEKMITILAQYFWGKQGASWELCKWRIEKIVRENAFEQSNKNPPEVILILAI